MQFNSYIFILCFLPVAVCGYFFINRRNYKLGDIFLIAMSIWFYWTAGIGSILLLGGSVVGNYALSYFIARGKQRKILLTIGVSLNTLLLFYFKYFNFVLSNFNRYVNTEFTLREIILPLGISFFTFQQIAYLVSCYRGETRNETFIEYAAYVLFFPKLLMGPLIEPKEFIQQLRDEKRKKLNLTNIVEGIQLFCIGLLKKLLFADTFAGVVSWGFEDIAVRTSLELMLIMLSYTFQIYFDFSGYSDMATGIAKMLNIDLPINFDSPYKSLSIREFWKKWHISLTKFLTNYLYIPLGGSKKGKERTYINTLVVFLISGIWHGANWTFILWGILHGLGQVTDRAIGKWYSKVPSIVRWSITFLIVNILWLLFRANSVTEWTMMMKNMLSFRDMSISTGLINAFVIREFRAVFAVVNVTSANTIIYMLPMVIMFILSFVICLLFENNYRRKRKNSAFSAVITAIVMTWCVVSLSSESVFIYNNF